MDCDLISTDFGAMSMRSVALRASKVGRLHGFLSSVFGGRWNQVVGSHECDGWLGDCGGTNERSTDGLACMHIVNPWCRWIRERASERAAYKQRFLFDEGGGDRLFGR